MVTGQFPGNIDKTAFEWRVSRVGVDRARVLIQRRKADLLFRGGVRGIKQPAETNKCENGRYRNKAGKDR